MLKKKTLQTLYFSVLQLRYSVMPKMAKDAIYKLLQQDLAGTLRSFLIGPIRSYLNRYTLEEVPLSCRQQKTVQTAQVAIAGSRGR